MVDYTVKRRHVSGWAVGELHGGMVAVDIRRSGTDGWIGGGGEGISGPLLKCQNLLLFATRKLSEAG